MKFVNLMHKNISCHTYPKDASRYRNVSSHSSIVEKDLNQFEKLLLQMCNRTRMIIANGVSLWPCKNGFTCRKHTGNSMIEYVLLSKGILDLIYKFSHVVNGHQNPIFITYGLNSNVHANVSA